MFKLEYRRISFRVGSQPSGDMPNGDTRCKTRNRDYDILAGAVESKTETFDFGKKEI